MTFAEAYEMRKSAASSPLLEGMIGAVPEVVLGGAPTIMGSLLGFADNPSAKQVSSRGYARNLIPGATAQQMMQRRRLVSKATGGKLNTITSEYLGPVTTSAALMLTGALAGAAYGAYKDKSLSAGSLLNGADEGLTAGTAAAGGTLVASALAALIARRRTLEEQAAYEKSPNSRLMNYIVPGAAVYNNYKSIGVSSTLTDGAKK